mmetsp:Transcript_9505/g.22745  ORF Transcript_9505/g.22745 Transcript_9505/m.22745 type:complete len:289 (-) Transcript_9505:260-1126(-)
MASCFSESPCIASFRSSATSLCSSLRRSAWSFLTLLMSRVSSDRKDFTSDCWDSCSDLWAAMLERAKSISDRSEFKSVACCSELDWTDLSKLWLDSVSTFRTAMSWTWASMSERHEATSDLKEFRSPRRPFSPFPTSVRWELKSVRSDPRSVRSEPRSVRSVFKSVPCEPNSVRVVVISARQESKSLRKDVMSERTGFNSERKVLNSLRCVSRSERKAPSMLLLSDLKLSRSFRRALSSERSVPRLQSQAERIVENSERKDAARESSSLRDFISLWKPSFSFPVSAVC